MKKYKATSFFKVTSWIFFIVSVLMVAYVYYQSEIIFMGKKHEYYTVYYILSIISTFLWTVILNLKSTIREKVVIVAISIVISAYIIEGLLFLFLGSDLNHKRIIAANNIGVDFDTRTKIEVIQDFIDDGVDAFPSVHATDLVKTMNTHKEDTDKLYPLGGVSNKVTVSTNENGKYMVFNSDRYGFNNLDL